MPSTTQQGYLLLADISGFTSFLAKSELDHANEILTDLLGIITKQCKSHLTISKLEGDAVFAYASAEQVSRGETILDLIEATYAAFRNRLDAVHRRTTCECNACKSIPVLDLKFMTHFGQYAIQNVGGSAELIGSDVNLVHRLLKNKVTEATGWRGYALFTEATIRQIGIETEGMLQQDEEYEHLGKVNTFTMNLQQRLKELAKMRFVKISKEEAHVVLTTSLTAPPTVVWDWLNDPQKRLLWSGLEVRPLIRPGGRLREGAQNHCVHGKNVMIESVLDWRPFDYFTVETTSGLGKIRSTYALEETSSGTILEDRTRLSLRWGFLQPLAKPTLRMIYKMIKADKQYVALSHHISAHTHQTGEQQS
jgi:class 3 adenylate cyclase